MVDALCVDGETAASLSEYADALANAKKNRVEQENELDTTEKKVGKNMKAAMDKLQKLEEGVMLHTKEILTKMINFESSMFNKLAESLEPGGDIEQTVSYLRSTSSFVIHVFGAV